MKKQSQGVAPPRLSAGLRRYLYVTAAVTGAAIMIVEILGAKMLAPYFGTSHFVWTAQIAVALVALATGYYAGGRMADRSQQLGRLYAAVLGAAVYLASGILFIRPLANACLGFSLALGSLAASVTLFFVPLSLMAMVGPFFVRVLASSLTDVGSSVGRLTAISTVGSFLGTVLIGYVLIPWLPNSWTLYLTAGTLAALVAGYFLFWQRSGGRRPAIAAGLLLVFLAGGAGIRSDARSGFNHAVEVFRGNSNFGQLQVVDMNAGTHRYFLNDYLVQNGYDPVTKKSLTLFTYMLHGLAHAYTPRVQSALCIGLGVGLVPTQLALEGVRVDAVEINPAVAGIGEKYFDSRPDRFNVVIADGRQFLNATTNRYDTIILDAFLGDSTPSHLMSREAFDSMRRLLNPGGTLVINSFSDFSSGRDFLGASLEKTLKSVFKSVRVHSSRRGNVFFVASDQPRLEILKPPDFASVSPSVRGEAEATLNALTESDPRHGIVLTDDYNPVEFHDAGVRESIRRQLAIGMRSF